MSRSHPTKLTKYFTGLLESGYKQTRSLIKELTEQVARDRKWKRSMNERMENVIDLQESLQTKEREKTTESLQMAMNREAKKKKIPAKKDEEDEEDEEADMHSEPMRELWFWELCYHRCGYRIVLTKIVHILQPCLPTAGPRRLKVTRTFLGRPMRRGTCLNVMELTKKY
jgi:hypothetical protein